MEEETKLLIFGMGLIIMILYIRMQQFRGQRLGWLNRRWWTRPINKNRKELGEYNLFLELKYQDTERFHKYTRMTPQAFDSLLTLLKPKLLKRSQRESICPEQRLAMTLRYLAKGMDYETIATSYRAGISTVHNIIKECCTAIVEVLTPIVLATPDEATLLEIKEGFWKRWNMPNCIGAIDGKHICIQAPSHSGSLYFNYKKYFSIVLMAVCDSNYYFTYVDVGQYGGISDGGVLEQSALGKGIRYNNLGIPKGLYNLPNSENCSTLFFVADDAFPLGPRIMKPYSGARLSEMQMVFNYRLSRSRNVIENAFGILSSRWRIFRRPIAVDVSAVDTIVLSTICLHNFIKRCEENVHPVDRVYCSPNLIDWEDSEGTLNPGDWRNNVTLAFRAFNKTNIRRASRASYGMRDTLRNYFVSDGGSIPWQIDYIRRGKHASS